jgi:S1-C subfamily serine protease
MTSDPPQAGLYVRNRSRVSGPHTLDDLLRMIRRGTLGRAQEVSRDGVHWQHAGEFAELFGGPLSLGHVPAEGVAPVEPRMAQTMSAGGAAASGPGGRMYYRQSDHTSGPMSIAIIVSLAESGQLSPDAIVWEEGASSSRPAQSHPQLQSVTWPDGADDGSDGERVFGGPGVLILGALLVLLIAGVPGGIWWYHSSSSASSDTTAQNPTPSTTPSIQTAGAQQFAAAPAPSPVTPAVNAAAGMPVPVVSAPNVSPVLAVQSSPTPPPVSPAPAVSSPVNPVVPVAAADRSTVVMGVHDDAMLSQTVGLVVVGGTISRPGRDPFEFPISTGSCFAVSAEGHLITNNHVVQEDTQIRDQVRQSGADFDPHVWIFFGRTKYVAQVLFASPKNDLAVLKIDPPQRQPFFRLCGAGSAPRDADVFALGFPGVGREPLSAEEFQRKEDAKSEHHANVEEYFNERDFEYTLTHGVVSRTIPDSDGVLWIQHEAVVRHGNSGGPLVTAAGTVVGINTRLQTNEANDVQTNNSLEIAQFKPLLTKYVPTAVWDESLDAGR